MLNNLFKLYKSIISLDFIIYNTNLQNYFFNSLANSSFIKLFLYF
jgi:hypothetical protein